MRHPLSTDTLRRRYLDAKIWPTFRCTLSCPRCAAKPAMQRWSGYELSWEQYVRFIMRIEDQGLHLHLLDFTGGEPTLWPHLVQAIDFAKKRRIAQCVRVVSNGLNRFASDYGNADVVSISHYGALNALDILQLKKGLGRRLSVVRAIHMDPNLPDAGEKSLPANCTCIRMCLLGNTVYPCAVAGYLNVQGLPVESEFYAEFVKGHPDMQMECRYCFANYNANKYRISPIVFEAGVWNSPYNWILNFRGRFVRVRRWLARRYMKHLGQ